MRLLLITADSLGIKPLREKLSQAGITVVSLSDISNIGAVIAKEQPKLVLVDGEILGCQVLVALRSEPSASDVSVAFLTE
jgi:DNA-binding response OmpR family regulator